MSVNAPVMIPRVDIRRNRLIVKPEGFSPTFTMQMKAMGGKWDSVGYWYVPAYRAYYKAIMEAFKNFDPTVEAHAWFEESTTTPFWNPGALGHTEAFSKLYPYQKLAEDFLLCNPHPGCILDISPGLGKTAISIVAADEANFKNVLVIAQLSLLQMWVDETAKWTDGGLMRIAYGTAPSKGSGWWVTNYDTVVRHRQLFTGRRWDAVILDESILVKSRSAKRTEALNWLRYTFGRLWLLSGSPISRYADDLWAQLHLIDPEAWASYWKFVDWYCTKESIPWTPTPQVTGSRLDKDIMDDLADIIFVRKQVDVLPDLPDFIFQTIPVPLGREQQKAHDQLRSTFQVTLRENPTMTVPNRMVQLVRMQQITSNLANVGGPDISAKADVLAELVSTDGSVEYPMLVWAHWQEGAKRLLFKLRSAKKGLRVSHMAGETDVETRDLLVKDFQSGRLDVLILSPGVGKFGLTLTEARTVVYMEKSWNADDYVQSMARVKRIGLKHRPRMITLKAPHTVDELVEKNLIPKMFNIGQVSAVDLADLLDAL